MIAAHLSDIATWVLLSPLTDMDANRWKETAKHHSYVIVSVPVALAWPGVIDGFV